MRRRIGVSYRVGPIGLFMIGIALMLVGTAIVLFWVAALVLVVLYLAAYGTVLAIRHRRRQLPKTPKVIHEPRHYVQRP